MENSLVERRHLTFVTLYSHYHLTRFPPPVVKDHSHVQGFCHTFILSVGIVPDPENTKQKLCVETPAPAPASWE